MPAPFFAVLTAYRQVQYVSTVMGGWDMLGAKLVLLGD